MIIGTIPKGKNAFIQVETKEYKGYPYIDIRTYFNDEESGEARPTKKGITLNPASVDDLIGFLSEAKEKV